MAGTRMWVAAMGLALCAAAPGTGFAETEHALLWSTPEAGTGPGTVYGEGVKAMNELRWQDAVASFDKVAQEKGPRQDAALYWKAYSLKKLNNGQAAMATCTQLRAQFAKSIWNRDCGVLGMDTKLRVQLSGANQDRLIGIQPSLSPSAASGDDADELKNLASEVKDASGGRNRGPDEDLKILAMNSLMNQEPSKAVPLLRGMLAGNQSNSVKQHALFVLSQSKTPEAEAAMRDAVLGKMGVEVQREAIQSSGVFLGRRENGTLVEVYHATADARIKRSVVSALFVSNDSPRMVELAKGEKDMTMKREIVSQLALMHDKAAEDYMLELLK